MQVIESYKRSVIFGAGGFIGIKLAQELAKEEGELVCFDRFRSPHWPGKARTIIGEFGDLPSELLTSLEDAVVYHLISSCRPCQKTNNSVYEVINDISNTLRYLEHTCGKNLRWVFLSSGGTVYGENVRATIPEDAPTEPICSYGIVKLSLEKYFSLYHRLHDTDYVVARVSNPYGPGQDPLRGQGVISAIIYKALTCQPVEIWGDGENIRDYLYLDDAIRGVLDVARHGEAGTVCNVGSGKGFTINQLIEIISQMLNICIDVRYVPARVSDVRASVLDNSMLRKLAGWQQRTPLETGIKHTADWIVAQCLSRA